jgi:3-dehydroquinate synthase II
MKKQVWVKIIPWDKDKATFSIESGADALVIPEGFSKEVKKLGLIKTVAPDGDIKLGDEALELEIKSKEDELEALKLSKSKVLLLKMADWTVIPIENLLAQTEGLMIEVKNAEEARTAVQILEKGADGVVITSENLNEIKKAVKAVKEEYSSIDLSPIVINSVKPLGMGDRVCVDTCSNMSPGEGILAGNSSGAMFLVHAETAENPYVAPRPFRVNAGAVHAYTLTPGGKTRYLGELRSSEEALIVNSEGAAKPAVIGRVKIEKRPLISVEGETSEGEKTSLILQNAETVRLTGRDGESISVVDLKNGDEVLGYLTGGARHFGMKIEETIQEK